MTEILRSDTAAFLLLDADANELVARAAKGIEEEVEQGVRIPVGRGFAGRIAAEKRPIFIEDVDHADILNPILRERGIRSLLGVPLLAEGEVVGVLHVGTLTPRVFTADDAELLQLAGDRAAMAIAHARAYERERTLAANAAGAPARHRRRAQLPAAGSAAGGAAGADDRDPALRHRRVPAARRGRRRAGRDGREGDRGGGRAGRPDPARARVRGPGRGAAPRDLHRGHRPRRHPATRSCASAGSGRCSACRC